MATIKITSGNTATEELTLSDRGHTEEEKGKWISWKLIDNPVVDSIENIVVTCNARLFQIQPRKTNVGWEAKLKNNAPENVEAKYSIFWKAAGINETLEHDPKISVKPTPWAPFPTLLIGTIAVIAGILTLSLWSKKIKW